MRDIAYHQDEPICALATGWGQSALGIIRISGPGTLGMLRRIFSRPKSLDAAPGYSAVHGHILKTPGGPFVDEVLVTVFRGTRSYTGQEGADISCHGGLPAVQGILESLRGVGFRDAAPGEFTLRAFLSGKLDLTRAEAVHEIVTAKTSQAHTLALRRLSGAVERRIDRIKGDLMKILSALELRLDYPEDELGDAALPSSREVFPLRHALEELASTYRMGQLFQEGFRVAFAGRTNAGKSSLFNLFLREDRAIVSDSHGTTRDYLEAWVALEGIPLCLVDTAGFRRANSGVEAEGIRRSEEIIKSSHLVIYIIDGAEGMNGEDRRVWKERTSAGPLLVWNKVDVSDAEVPEGTLPVSALTGKGYPLLQEEILRRIRGDEAWASAESGQGVIDSSRQKHLLDRAAEALEQVEKGLASEAPLDGIAMDTREALNSLGEITGEVTSTDILKTMFSDFCVGK